MPAARSETRRMIFTEQTQLERAMVRLRGPIVRVKVLMQWQVTVTDNHGNKVGPFIVAATSERRAIAKARDFFKRQAPKGTWPVRFTPVREV
jgi:hypothetical protein